jgi:predicted RNA-binding protein with EMAP domain
MLLLEDIISGDANTFQMYHKNSDRLLIIEVNFGGRDQTTAFNKINCLKKAAIKN